MENKETVFRVGDRVFTHCQGWGKVIDLRIESKFPISVKFDDGTHDSFTFDGNYAPYGNQRVLSFTEYDFVNGGFSQERPIEIPNRGEIVWVKGDINPRWIISHFIKYEENMFVCSCANDDNTYSWRYLTTQNPYENEQ